MFFPRAICPLSEDEVSAKTSPRFTLSPTLTTVVAGVDVTVAEDSDLAPKTP